MASLQPPATQGRVNGLERPRRFPDRRPGLPRPRPLPLIAAGAGLYVAAMVFPIVLRQVNGTIFVAAIAGTALLIAGLHVRWTRNAEKA